MKNIELKKQQDRIDFIRKQLPAHLVVDIEKVHVWRELQADLHDKNPEVKDVKNQQTLLDRYENAYKYHLWRNQ